VFSIISPNQSVFHRSNQLCIHSSRLSFNQASSLNMFSASRIADELYIVLINSYRLDNVTQLSIISTTSGSISANLLTSGVADRTFLKYSFDSLILVCIALTSLDNTFSSLTKATSVRASFKLIFFFNALNKLVYAYTGLCLSLLDIKYSISLCHINILSHTILDLSYEKYTLYFQSNWSTNLIKL